MNHRWAVFRTEASLCWSLLATDKHWLSSLSMQLASVRQPWVTDVTKSWAGKKLLPVFVGPESQGWFLHFLMIEKKIERRLLFCNMWKLLHMSINEVLLGCNQAHSFTYAYGCLQAAGAELSSFIRDHTAYKAEKIYYLDRKSLPISSSELKS